MSTSFYIAPIAFFVIFLLLLVCLIASRRPTVVYQPQYVVTPPSSPAYVRPSGKATSTTQDAPPPYSAG
ncbi:uncharacterized protein AB675_7961 [Cyphellophora attinorum]|uniref:Uncharacterized protein n=1 Tax=Cyphellophora attinorum TaxID=1664694 RepID=A0A0N1HB64_9EURO|nr:uncharacterized protein AB675_7961 [Phialophora attinorum]KPI41237.1 hypothetical protein AB675_7961 [Phialophora attinorum]